MAAQAVNFFILLYLLKRFLYKPILKVLDERKNKIAESLSNAEKIQKQLEQTETESKKRLEQAQTAAKLLLSEAESEASKLISDAKKIAKIDIEKMIASGKQDIEAERIKMYSQIQKETARLIALSIEKLTGKVLTRDDQYDLIKRSLKGMP